MKLTDPGLGSGTFPVYSLHFESCTSMYGPSNTFCTSEKAYWQIADALIFFLKNNPPTPKTHPEDTLRINDSLRGRNLRNYCHTDQISNTSQIITGQ